MAPPLAESARVQCAQRDDLKGNPWEALANLNDYVAEGFKTGKFAAVAVTEPRALIMEDKQLARRLVTQDETTHNKEYCCLTVIKRTIVEDEPETAAKIARAFRRAREWAGQHPRQAVLAAQTAGYYGTTVPVEASVKAVECCLSFDTQLDVAQALEGAFATRIELGASRPISRRRSWRVCTIGNSDKQLPDGDRSNCTSSDPLRLVRNCLGRQQRHLALRITFDDWRVVAHVTGNAATSPFGPSLHFDRQGLRSAYSPEAEIGRCH